MPFSTFTAGLRISLQFIAYLGTMISNTFSWLLLLSQHKRCSTGVNFLFFPPAIILFYLLYAIGFLCSLLHFLHNEFNYTIYFISTLNGPRSLSFFRAFLPNLDFFKPRLLEPDPFLSLHFSKVCIR